MSYSLLDKGHKFVIHCPFQRKAFGNYNCYVDKWEKRQNKTTKPKSTPSLQLCGRAKSLLLVLLPVGNFCKLREHFCNLLAGIFVGLPYLHFHCSDCDQRSFTDSCVGPTKPKSTSHGLPVQFCGGAQSVLLVLLPVSNFCKLREQLYIFATWKLVFSLLPFLTYTFLAMIEYWVFKYPSEVVGVTFLQFHCYHINIY